MSEAFIVDAVRTPIGRFRGALKGVRPDDLAAHVLRALLERNAIEGARVDEVFLGCANQAGEDNRNVARMALLLAGLPASVPGVTVNRLCASGLEAVIQGCRMIQVGEADIVLAGGVESMTRAPWSMPKPEDGFPSGKWEAWDTSLGWRYPNPRLAALFPLEQMGETAENVAEKWSISREAQDRFALDSHRKAVAAHAAGAFTDELVAVEVPQSKGATTRVEADEGPRADTTLERLSTLKPAFRQGGSVTAGNASSLNDGASALLLMSGKALQETGATPMARYVSSASVGVDPRYMGMGPVPASRKALARAGWHLDSVDLMELNEAFAAQALACIQDLEVPMERVNVHGGGIALGHPLGSSGARILTTLAHAMERQHARRGLAALCVGVGQGLAMTVERVS
ncbi:thiolase family protein [Pyxidicoccus parkwayensis]|uniref:Thiolase family protein n=1 Tax=Pyxidicoccus parkwayensis TaxID=2813578 RepID=A0ABX7NJX7_9BACT|nr:thiolase family protein [Pyxidicoccus parkwaysis]QSQ18756.1 thiolase family protein [Pyxidicoccus parkwaysis]